MTERDRPTISHIFICAAGRLPMQEVPKVRAIANVGLEGDRYATARGSWSGGRPKERHVTLISARDIERANAQLAAPYAAAETRRNLVVSGEIDLQSLIGLEFTVGNVRLRGVEDAAPCAHPEKLAKKPGFMQAFTQRAGIRAALLSNGDISAGDVLAVSRAKTEIPA